MKEPGWRMVTSRMPETAATRRVRAVVRRAAAKRALAARRTKERP
jgi:hypothetical protein